MKERILILTNSIGGLYSFRKEVMKAIVDTGYEVYISEPDDDERVKYFEGIGCHIIKTEFNLRGMNPIADINLMVRYRKIIKKISPKAVLSYTIKPNIYGGIACRLTKTPQIVNVTGLGDAIENGGLLQKLTITLYKIGIRKAKRIFFQNETNRQFCIRHNITNEKSIVLPGSGVNLTNHSFQGYPTDDGNVRFLYIGRLMKDKGIDELFGAISYIKPKHPETEFQIIADNVGGYKEQLDECIQKGLITYWGETTDVRPYLKNIECTIMPSYHEGMSNVNLESAANGRPVITTDVPGCKETVDDGVTGFIVKAKNTQSLVNGVERFLRLTYEQKKQMGVNGRKKVEREFDRQIIVNAYLKEIENITNV